MQTGQLRIPTVPPHNLDAEEAVLGAVLISREAVAEIIEIFSDEPVFYKPTHNLIFEVVRDLFQQGQAIDTLTVSEELKKRGEIDRIGGLTYLHGLTMAVPTAAAASNYAQIVRDKFLLRRLIDACGKISAEAMADEDLVSEILDRAESDIFSLADLRIQKSFVTLVDALSRNFEELEQLKARRELVSGLPTGFNEFDRMTTGLHPGDLCILAARPSVGKTAFALNVAGRLAIHSGKRIAFFSLEMTVDALVKRILCSEARVPLHTIRRGNVSDRDWRRLTDMASKIIDRTAPLHIDDSTNLTVLDMMAKARRLATRGDGRLDLIIVDYLQMVEPSGKFENRQLAVAEISRGLKRLAKELKVPVIALSQLSRRVEERAGMRPQLSDLRESGSLEQDADLVVFLHRDDGGGPDKKPQTGTYPVELIIGKQRNGPVGTVNLVFFSEITRFENYVADTRVADVGATV